METGAKVVDNKWKSEPGTVDAAPTPKQPGAEAPDMPASKSTKAPAFQFYPKDFLGDEEQSLMSLAEAGAYVRLMSRCWLKGSLPPDTPELARLCGATSGQMVKLWPAISKCFSQRADGRWLHPRLEKERKKQAEYKRRQADAADKRWEKHRISQNDATALPPHSQRNALQSSSSSSSASTPTKNVGVVAPPAKSSSIVKPRRKDAAWEGFRVYVPQRAHNDFLAFRGGPAAEGELLAWYQAVSEAWGPGGPCAAEEPGADMFAFWKARYAERWPVTTPVHKLATQGWSCPHVDRCEHRQMCQNKMVIGPTKYPLKKAEAS